MLRTQVIISSNISITTTSLNTTATPSRYESTAVDDVTMWMKQSRDMRRTAASGTRSIDNTWPNLLSFLYFVFFLGCLDKVLCINMGRAMRKHVFGCMRTAKAQVSLRVRTVWSGPMLSAYRIIRYMYYIMFKWRADAWMRLSKRRMMWISTSSACSKALFR